jgi:glycosyltransferase involved in cell wall biosynthesis
VGNREVVALNPADESATYPPEVRYVIQRDTLADYYRVAWALNLSGADVISIQHEYGIWGGESGAYVLDFVHQLRRPFVATLHTILRHPSPLQRSILSGLVGASAASVVMSQAAASLLARTYDVDPARLHVIPHGVPNLPLVDPRMVKRSLGLGEGPMILSFGLLGPGKGYESVIEAMPAVVADFPTVRYVVLGATHPDLLRHEGEAYRQRLEARAADLGIADHVMFVDRFVDLSELGRWLEAADIFVTPYPNLDQIVSGTLAYAMGAGKAIVSTPYAYAAEMLALGRGRLITPGSPESLSGAFLDLLGDDQLRTRMGKLAYDHSRSMVWDQVASRYQGIFTRVAARSAPVRAVSGVGAFNG